MHVVQTNTHVTTFATCGATFWHCLYKGMTFNDSTLSHFHPLGMHSSLQRDALHLGSNHVYDLISFTTRMPLHIARVSAAIWKWFYRCPDVIGPVHDISSDEDFYTPPRRLEQLLCVILKSTIEPIYFLALLPWYLRHLPYMGRFRQHKAFDLGVDISKLSGSLQHRLLSSCLLHMVRYWHTSNLLGCIGHVGLFSDF